MDVGYARVSTEDQDLTIQLTALDRAGSWPIHQEKKSGKAGTDRPVRDQTLAQLQPGDTLTVWALDRLGRSVIELRKIIEGLDRHGVRFRCLKQPIDTTSPTGRLFLTFLAGFAEFEREMILERTAAGKQRRAAEGKHPGGRRLFGLEPDHETVVETEAALLRKATERLRDGESMSALLNAWNDQGIPAANGGRWQATPLRQILTNPRIVAVIGQENYEAMVRLFADAAGRQRLGAPAAHLLSGILRCHCGQAMYALATGKKQRAYRCRKAEWSGGRSAGCGKVSVSEPAADHWAEEAFIAAVCSEHFAAALDRRRAELLAGETTAAQLDDWRAEVAELGQVLETRFGTADHRKRHDDLQRLVRQATAQLMRRPELQAIYDLPRTESKLRAAWDGWSIAERRTWLRRVFWHITVKPATSRGRGSDVAARLDPLWKV